MTQTHAYAGQANDMAGMARARVRVFGSCPAVVTDWSPIALGTTAGRKHGQPRSPQESP